MEHKNINMSNELKTKLREMDQLLVERALGEYWNIKVHTIVFVVTLASVFITDAISVQIGVFVFGMLFFKNIEAIETEMLCYYVKRRMAINSSPTDFTVDDVDKMISMLKRLKRLK